MKRVFISYRRNDTQAIAGRLYDGLESRLGKDSVFFDIDSDTMMHRRLVEILPFAPTLFPTIVC